MRFFTIKLCGEMEVNSFLFCFEFQTYFLKIFTDTFFTFRIANNQKIFKILLRNILLESVLIN
jgi:hypothetical protein